MAGNISRIYIEVAVDGKGGIKILRQIGAESEKTGKKGKRSFQDMARGTGDFNKKIGLTRKLVGGMGALFTGWGLSRTIRSMAQFVSLAEEQRKSIAGMETAMRSMGRYTPQMSRALQDYATSLQQVTNFGDEATMEGVKFLMTYRDITDELMFRSIGTMQDVAALMGGDMRQAANMLGKASMGMVGELRRIGITVDSATYKAEGYLGVLKAIETQVSGQAAAMRDPWTQLANVIGDSKEALGGFIGIAFEDYANDMIRLLPELSKSWQELAESVKETKRVFIEYQIVILESQLAGKGVMTDMPGTMAPDFTIFGMTDEEEKALQEKLERFKGFLEDLKKASEEASKKTTVPGPDAKALKELQKIEEKLWEYEVKAAQRADEELIAAHEAMIEYEKSMYADAAKNKIDMTAQMYSDLKFSSDAYYAYQLDQLTRQADDYETFTGNAALAHLWLTEQIKALDKERLEASGKSNQYLIDFSQRTAEAMEQNFSDFYFDVMRGEFDDLEDYATAVLRSIQRATADVMGQMTKEALFGGGSSGSPGLISEVVKWIGSSGSDGSAGYNAADWADTLWAKGGVFERGRVQAFARGTIVDRPTIFPMASGAGLMGEAGPEGVLPLARTSSGDLGVKTVGATGGDVSIQVNVINNGEPLESTEPPEVRFDGQKYVVDVHMDKMINSRSYRQANKQVMR